MSPEVSVVMTVYNGAARLRKAVECILTQTCDDFEFIVIDDGSTDETSTILDTYTDPRIVRLRNETNLGLTQSLNTGLDHAKGEYIARQDCDDQSQPSRLAKQVAYFDSHPSTVLQGSAAREVGPAGENFGVHAQPCGDRTIRWKILLHNPFIHSSVMLRRCTLFKHNLKYDPKLPYSQDFDLWSRFLPYGRVSNLPDPLIDLHLHAGQATKIAWESQQNIADQIAQRNIATINLDMSLTEDDLAILRWRSGKKVARERWHRMREGRLLFSLLQAYNACEGKDDAEWKRVRQEQLHYIRQCLSCVSVDPKFLAAQFRVAAHDPSGLLKDLGRKITQSFQTQPDQ